MLRFPGSSSKMLYQTDTARKADMYPLSPQVTYSQDIKYHSTASQNTLKYSSIIYVTSSLSTLLKTAFDDF